MWSPTHVQVTVCRVKGLITKGKNGTNDAFVTIGLGKEKFQTSVKQKASPDLEWNEECELPIPTQGNTAEIVLTALHQNFIGVDEFLGTVALPLSNFDVYQQAKTRWYPLKSKPGQESKTKYRGEIEVRVAFTVKSGSLLDLSKKEKLRGSVGQLGQAAQSFGGSLLSLGGKDRKGIKKFASSVGHKLKLPGRSHSSKEDKNDDRLSRHSSGRFSDKFSSGEPDPGVISEDDDEFRFDELSHKSSGSSLNLAGSHASDSLENLGGGELLRRNSMNRSGTLPSRLASTSSSSTSINQGRSQQSGSKGPFQDDSSSDWNQKLFGKQSKVNPPPSFKEEESTTVGGVPSIIIQDSFIVPEEPPVFASPRSSDRAKKSNTVTVNTVANDEESAKPPTSATHFDQSPKLSSPSPSSLRNRTESPTPGFSPVAPAVSPTASEVSQVVSPPKPRQRKDSGGKAGEEDDVPSARMTNSFAPSLPVELALSPASRTEPPVPKPRNLVSNTKISSSVFSPANPFDADEPTDTGRSYSAHSTPVNVLTVSSPANPFDDDEPVEVGRFSAAAIPKPFASSHANPFDNDDDEPVEIGRSYAVPKAVNSITISSGGNPFDCEPDDPSETNNGAHGNANPFDEDDDPVEIGPAAHLESIIPTVSNDEVVILSPMDDSSLSQKTLRRETPFFHANTIDTILETTEIVSEEDSVCLLLEQAIEGHDDVQEAINNVSVIRVGDEGSACNSFESAATGEMVESSVDDAPPVNSMAVTGVVVDNKTVDVVELYNEDNVWMDGAIASLGDALTDEEDEIQRRKRISLTPALKTMVLRTPNSDLGTTLDELDETNPVQDVRVVQLDAEEASPISESRSSDLFLKETEKISPVERAGQRPDYTTPPVETTEASGVAFRKDRFYSLFSTPTSNERGNESLGLVTLNWSEAESSSHSNSQTARSEGYVGSELMSANSSWAAPPEQTKANDSAVIVEESKTVDDDIPSPFAPAKRANPSLTPQEQSMRPDLSWDNYDMRFVTPPDDGAPSNAAGSTSAARKEELTLPCIQEETSVSKKRISLAPSLKSMVLDDSSPTNESVCSDLDSPLVEQAAAAENHRQKMAASFHQRVVVGEEVSSVANNDFSSGGNSMSTPRKSGRDLQHQYQGKSREELIGLLQTRDNEVKDLKEYIDTLLLRVIEACPTVLQTPDRKTKK